MTCGSSANSSHALVPVVTARSPDSAAFRTVTLMSDTGIDSSVSGGAARRTGRPAERLDRIRDPRRDACGFRCPSPDRKDSGHESRRREDGAEGTTGRSCDPVGDVGGAPQARHPAHDPAPRHDDPPGRRLVRHDGLSRSRHGHHGGPDVWTSGPGAHPRPRAPGPSARRSRRAPRPMFRPRSGTSRDTGRGASGRPALPTRSPPSSTRTSSSPPARTGSSWSSPRQAHRSRFLERSRTRRSGSPAPSAPVSSPRRRSSRSRRRRGSRRSTCHRNPRRGPGW